MYEFTKKETERINQLYGNDFEGIEPEDAMLIAHFEVNKALQQAEFDAHIKSIQAESDNRIRLANEQHSIAIDNLLDLKKKAVAIMERVQNEQ